MYGAIVGGAMQAVANEMQAQRNYEYNKKQMQYGYTLNEMAAENANRRGMNTAIWEQQNLPSYTVEGLKKAGLSKGLMYTNGAGGTVGTGAQGAGAGQAQNVMNAPYIGVDPLTMAQIENINADTQLKKADAENKGAEKGKTEAETETINRLRDYLVREEKEKALMMWYQNMEKKIEYGWGLNQTTDENGNVTVKVDALTQWYDELFDETFDFLGNSKKGWEIMNDINQSIINIAKTKEEKETAEIIKHMKQTENEKLFEMLEATIIKFGAESEQAQAMAYKAYWDSGCVWNAKQIINAAGTVVGAATGVASTVTGGMGAASMRNIAKSIANQNK